MSKNIFNSVQYPRVGSNTFDLSHDVKLSFKMGQLVPTVVMDTVPGDRFRLTTETMLRFLPLISPVMHRVNVTTHFFFVPNRIIWPSWERWITGEIDVQPPIMIASSSPFEWPQGSLADYMGVPTGRPLQATNINALPFAAYRRIWFDYYRDQNLQLPGQPPGPLTGQCGNGNNPGIATQAMAPPLHRAWQHDYFTASLPFAQKGDAVTIPIGNFTDVDIVTNPLSTNATALLNASTGGLLGTGNVLSQSGEMQLDEGGGPIPVKLDPVGNLLAQTSQLTTEAADINSLRRAFRLQEWLEKDARGGSRYIENIAVHFGVKSSDARLNRPEYLGGSRQTMVISEVLSTAETDVPVGEMAGHGISVGAGKEFSYRCEEHGWIIGILNVQPVTAYQDGLERKFYRPDRLDYFWPTFQHIGEQEVYNREIFATNDLEQNAETFGYVPRYAEYRYMNSRVAGEMRTTLSHWHLGRIFDELPVLNDEFVVSNPSTRIFAVEDGDHIVGHVFNRIKALRKMSKYGTPSF